MMCKPQGFRHTSAVQSGPESSESEISEYSDDLFLSSDFTLEKNPEGKKREKEKGVRNLGISGRCLAQYYPVDGVPGLLTLLCCRFQLPAEADLGRLR